MYLMHIALCELRVYPSPMIACGFKDVLVWTLVPVKAELYQSIEIDSNQFLKTKNCTLLAISNLSERCASLFNLKWSLVVEYGNHYQHLALYIHDNG